MKENIEYLKENFGEEYVLPLIVSKNIKNLKEILPYLKEKGYLEYIKDSASILTLTLEQIKEREHFIEQIGEKFVTENGKFNSIFGMSKKNYQKKVKAKSKSSSSIASVVNDVTVTEGDEAMRFLNSITQEKTIEETVHGN